MASFEELQRRAADIGIERQRTWRFLVRAIPYFARTQDGFENAEQFLLEREGALTGVPAPLSYAKLPNVSGPMRLGRAVRAVLDNGRLALRYQPVGLRGYELLNNVMVAGMMNSGKTSVTRIIAHQLARGLVVDRETEFDMLAARRRNIVRLSMEDFKHNPFDVRQFPERLREKYLTRLVETICIQAALYGAAEALLTDIVLTVYRNGVQREGSNFVLVWRDVLECLHRRLEQRGMSSNMRTYLERDATRLDLLDATLGRVFSTRNSMMPFLGTALTVLNVEGIPDRVLTQLVNILMVWTHVAYPVLRPDRIRLRAARVLDEAHLYLSKHAETAGEPPFAVGMLRDRKRGIANIFATHVLSQVHPLIRNQCRIKIFLRQGSEDEAEIAARELWGRNCTAKQVHGLRVLPTGWAFMKHPRSTRPLLMKVLRYA